VIATDLARLLWLKRHLSEGRKTVVWLDADFLIFHSEKFILPKVPYALGREVWIQNNKRGQLRAYKKVHNAFLMFRQDNAFLDFYIDSAERLLELAEPTVPPQFIGPKLLTAIHNIVHCPILESAGMLSPMVMQEILDEPGEALSLLAGSSSAPLHAANLSSSVAQRDGLSDVQMEVLINQLLSKGLPIEL